MRKRILSTLLALCMVLTLLPGEALMANAEGNVRVNELTVTIDNGEPISLLPGGTEINLKLGISYAFQVVFNHHDEIKRVYVTSSKDGEKRYLEAIDNGSGVFITNGYFGGDANYIPGTISVEYSKSSKTLQDGGWLTLKSPLGLEKVSISTNEPTSVRGRADITDLIDSEADAILIDFAAEVFDTTVDTDMGTWLGDKYKSLRDTIENLEDGTFTCIDPDADLGDPGTYVMVLKDAHSYYKIIMNVAGDKAPNLASIAESLYQNEKVISLMSDYIEIRNEKEELREQIEASNTIPNKVEAYEKLDAYSNDRLWFSTISTILPVAIAATGGTMAIPAIIFSAYMKVINASADYFWDYRIGMIQGCDPVEDVFPEDGEHPGWTTLTSQYLWDNGSKIKTSGRYYIAEEEINRLTVLEGLNVTICLHGHTLGAISIGKDTTLKICDCKYAKESDGTITGGIISRPITIESGNELTIDGGIIQGNYGHAISNNGGKLVINDGTIQGINGHAIYDVNGDITINGGSLTTRGGDCIRVDNSNLTINGGRISGDPAIGNNPSISAEEDTILTIRNDIIHGSITTSGPGEIKTALIIDRESDIQIGDNTDLAFSVVPTVKRAAGYTGGAIYYDSPDAVGVKKRFDDVQKINFAALTYIRLVASGAAAGDNCDHEYKSSVTFPTCTNQGYTTYTCSLCGKNYTDNYVTALGHRYGEWVTIKEPTAAASGQKERICSVCGDRQVSTIPATGGSGNVTPSTPGKPSNPEKPVEKPTESEKPDESITPIQPETPVQPERPSIPVYVDVAPDAWYNEATAYVASRGLMTGTSATNFSPDEQMTRAQAWTLLARMSGAAVEGSTPWYAGAQAWAVSAGISDGTDPDGNITRKQLAVMLYRQAGSPLTAADHPDVSGWALPAIEWAVSVGLLQGDGARLNPAAPATRAEVAALLMRFCESTGK